MDELQKKLSQRHDARSRKVRFKISSAYSGRVLKQVYEDGQELEIPQEEYPHSFRHWNFEPRDHFFGIGETAESRFCPPAKLNAQRISVFREGNKYTLTSSPSLLNEDPPEDSYVEDKREKSMESIDPQSDQESDTTEWTEEDDIGKHPPILDFGKIIIYTSNLKIIRTPMTKKELVRKIMQNEGIDDYPFTYDEERRGNSSEQGNGNVKDPENELAPTQQPQEGDDENGCPQCKGSGSAPCSVCHGSKFSMLANRFKESYRALRCPACNENGQQPCQTCVQ